MKVVMYALVANLGIALAKLAGALVSGSASLMAESIHSAVDCVNQVLLLIGAKKSRRKPNKRHPLGHGREAFFWSFLVAIALFGVGGVYSIYEGVHKLRTPGHEELSHPALSLGILAFGFILEFFSFRACLEEIRIQNRHGSLLKWFQRTTSADLLVIFAEDLAALLGLAIAAISVGLAWVTGESAWDSAGSVLVGTLLLLVASFLAREVKSLLIGEAAETDFRAPLEKLLAEKLPGSRILNLIALQIGSGSVMLSCKFHPGSIKSVDSLIEAINAVEREFRAAYPELTWQFFEPDSED